MKKIAILLCLSTLLLQALHGMEKKLKPDLNTMHNPSSLLDICTKKVCGGLESSTQSVQALTGAPGEMKTHIKDTLASNYSTFLWQKFADKSSKITLEGHTAKITSLALSIDDNFAVTGSKDNTARVWDAKTGSCIHELKGHAKQITSVAISSRNSFIVTGSEDKTIKIWDMATGACSMSYSLKDRIRSLALSNNDKFIVVAAANAIRIIDIESGNNLKGSQFASNYIYSLTISRDDNLIAIGLGSGTFALIDVKTRTCIEQNLIEHSQSINSIALSNDKNIIVAGLPDGTARICNRLTNDAGVLVLDEDSILREFYDKYLGKYGWGSDFTKKVVFEDRSGRRIKSFSRRPFSQVTVALSSDGKLLVTKLKGIVQLWDMTTKKCIKSFNDKAINGKALQISRKSSLIASSSRDHTVTLWNIGNCIDNFLGISKDN